MHLDYIKHLLSFDVSLLGLCLGSVGPVRHRSILLGIDISLFGLPFFTWALFGLGLDPVSLIKPKSVTT